MIRRKFDIIFSKAALEELNLIIDFYKKLMFRLARNLIIEMHEVLMFLKNNPHAYDDYYDGKFGVITMRKYPVEIYYHIENQKIIVLAIRHKNEKPLKWVERV